jgi:hypothetical protein
VRAVFARSWDKYPSVLITRLASRGGIPALRISLGVIYLWFGIPKFWSGVSPADQLAVKTMGVIDLHTVPPGVARDLLATMETTIGAGLLFAVFLPGVLLLQAVQMLGTLSPLLFFRSEMWTQTLVPSLEGQYIIKNFVLISAGLTITATLRGGGLVSSPTALAEDRAAPVPWPDRAEFKSAVLKRLHSWRRRPPGSIIGHPPVGSRPTG